MKICPKCYQKVESETGFCPLCGAELVDRPIPNTKGDQADLPDDYFIKNAGNKRIKKALIFTLVGAFGLWIFFWYLPSMLDAYETHLLDSAYALVLQGDYEAAEHKVRYSSEDIQYEVKAQIYLHKNNGPLLEKMIGEWVCEEEDMYLNFGVTEQGSAKLKARGVVHEGPIGFNLYVDSIRIFFKETDVHQYADFLISGENDSQIELTYDPKDDLGKRTFIFKKQAD